MKKLISFEQAKIPLKEYDLKFSQQGSLAGFKVLSNGACVAYVLYFIYLFESLKEKNIKSKIKKIIQYILQTEKLASELYYWHGLQTLIAYEFKIPNPYSPQTTHQGLSPDEKNKIIQDLIYTNKAKEISYIKDISKRNKREISNAKISFVMNRYFLESKHSRWNYIGSVIEVHFFQFLKFLESIAIKFDNNNYDYIAITLTVSLSYQLAHKVCILFINDPDVQYIIFDPNFGIFEIYSKEDLTLAFTTLILNRYKSQTYIAEVMYI